MGWIKQSTAWRAAWRETIRQGDFLCEEFLLWWGTCLVEATFHRIYSLPDECDVLEYLDTFERRWLLRDRHEWVRLGVSSQQRFLMEQFIRGAFALVREDLLLDTPQAEAFSKADLIAVMWKR